MGRDSADHQLWQHRPVEVVVQADSFVGVTPYLPADLVVSDRGGSFAITGTYGMDTFRNDRFVLLVNGELRTFVDWNHIPQEFDNVIEFAPDDTHDLTFCFTFVKDGVSFTHTHWVHHDMEPWQGRLRELLARETNGGWNARSDSNPRRRHPALLPDGEGRRVSQRLLQRTTDLPPGRR